ncbi:hypothetical protein SAMN05216353_12416 [Halobacillus alkaliphilus]|uniref:Prenyltransferase and squalene oxidase repeat-containing protein n=1 Tax=Halobacillus alkaliphilus TaxID=396056 RepID=A0A1I2PHC7_9BACI|nr:hypothetical protein [Halobacillus alkaliphilus]SFG13046.1 hypothetical protein SAMN05216353_12416 [Halobacillus alkaliphilus]
MRYLSTKAFETSKNYILTNARDLEQARCSYLFDRGAEQAIIKALDTYQNQDGGFGHGLEADFRLPASSPIASSVALQVLYSIDHYPEAQEMISKALNYFERSFNKERQGWLAVPSEVNHYPHAFWWTVHENGTSWIDDNWGNPSAEIIGYLLAYKNEVSKLNADQLVSLSIKHLLSIDKFESEHEVFCYLRFFKMHPSCMNQEIHTKLKEGVRQLVTVNQEEWKNYVPLPLQFKPTPNSLNVGISSYAIENNLDYLVDRLEAKPYIEPAWKWDAYEDVWRKAKEEWQGVLTLEALQWLSSYGRVVS